MFRPLLTLLAVLLACASAPRPAAAPRGPALASTTPAPARPAAKTAPAPSESAMVCHYERPLGSNIAEKVCRNKTQVELDRERTQDMMRLTPQPQMRGAN